MTVGRTSPARFLRRLAACVVVLASLDFARLPASAATPEAATERSDDASALAAVKIAGPFEYPWSIAFLPDHTLLLTEKPGRLQLIAPGAAPVAVSGVPDVVYAGHGGLLDVAIDPYFAHNATVYLSYAHGTEQHLTVRVMKARLDRSANALVDQRIIFESSPAANTEQLGGRMALTRDGHLFLTLGPRWQAARAQDLSDDAGKIIRIRTDGSVPGDNPFAAMPGARPDVWSYGHRNPQGLAFDPAGRLWSHEHGPFGGDELNLIQPGRNYGWPVITYGSTYSTGETIGEGTEKDGMEQPVRYWTPAIAPSGLAIQSVGATTIIWIGALAGRSLVMLEIDGQRVVRERRWLQDELGRIRDVRIGHDGFLYIVTDEARAWLYKLEPAVEQRRPSRFPRKRGRT